MGTATAIADRLPLLDDDDWLDPEQLERNEAVLRGFAEFDEQPWDDVILTMRRSGGEFV